MGRFPAAKDRQRDRTVPRPKALNEDECAGGIGRHHAQRHPIHRGRRIGSVLEDIRVARNPSAANRDRAVAEVCDIL